MAYHDLQNVKQSSFVLFLFWQENAIFKQRAQAYSHSAIYWNMALRQANSTDA